MSSGLIHRIHGFVHHSIQFIHHSIHRNSLLFLCLTTQLRHRTWREREKRDGVDAHHWQLLRLTTALHAVQRVRLLLLVGNGDRRSQHVFGNVARLDVAEGHALATVKRSGGEGGGTRLRLRSFLLLGIRKNIEKGPWAPSPLPPSAFWK